MIYLGADHGGFHLKEKIKKWLGEWGYEYEDCGNEKYDSDDDYPEFAKAVAEKVAKNELMESGGVSVPPFRWKERAMGILACRTAAGMVIAANKVKGVRAVAAFDKESARHSRSNNDANVIALSGDWLSDEKAKEVLKVWLDTEFSREERHKRRLEEIEEIEKSV